MSQLKYQFTTPCFPYEKHEYYGNDHILNYPLLSLLDNKEFEDKDIERNQTMSNKSKDKSIHSQPEQHQDERELLKGEIYKVFKKESSVELSYLLKKYFKNNTINLNQLKLYENSNLLHLAVYNDNLKVIKYLIEDLNIYIDQMDDYMETALLKSTKKGNLTISNYLISKGADINKKDYQGFNALHKATSSGNLDLVKLIIEEYHIGPNSISDTKFTPLMTASTKNQLAIIKYLVNQIYQPVDVLISNKLNITAYSIACSCKYYQIADVLYKAEVKQSGKEMEYHTTPHQQIMVMIYENQRMEKLGGIMNFFQTQKKIKFTQQALLKSDNVTPFQLANSTNNSPIDLLTFELQKHQQGSWDWLSEWEIFKSESHDPKLGWQYNTEFNSNTPWSSNFSYELKHQVRRRAWIRIASRETMEILF